jgi:hypothetical protein
MASYQDIEVRLRTIEEKVEFIFDHMRMRAAITTGVLNANGQPEAKIIETTLRDLYYQSKQTPIVHESPTNQPPLIVG